MQSTADQGAAPWAWVKDPEPFEAALKAVIAQCGSSTPATQPSAISYLSYGTCTTVRLRARRAASSPRKESNNERRQHHAPRQKLVAAQI